MRAHFSQLHNYAEEGGMILYCMYILIKHQGSQVMREVNYIGLTIIEKWRSYIYNTV